MTEVSQLDIEMIKDRDAESLAASERAVAAIIKEYLHIRGYEYKPLSSHQSASINALESAMECEMDRLNIRCKQLEKTLHLSASSGELMYPNNTFEEKLNMALYFWYIFYVDDTSTSGDPTPFVVFLQRFLKGQKQLDPVLDAFAGLLIKMTDYYDPLCFTLVVSGSFQYIFGTCLERDFEKVPAINTVLQFPWYIRQAVGLGQAFTVLAFPLSKGFNVLDILPALPNMDIWTCLLNDFFSFHKEELAGEMNNYVHNRAIVEGKPALEILRNIGDELKAASTSIYGVLSSNHEALAAWKAFENGYIEWHMVQERYKLKSLLF